MPTGSGFTQEAGDLVHLKIKPLTSSPKPDHVVLCLSSPGSKTHGVHSHSEYILITFTHVKMYVHLLPLKKKPKTTMWCWWCHLKPGPTPASGLGCQSGWFNRTERIRKITTWTDISTLTAAWNIRHRLWGKILVWLMSNLTTRSPAADPQEELSCFQHSRCFEANKLLTNFQQTSIPPPIKGWNWSAMSRLFQSLRLHF